LIIFEKKNIDFLANIFPICSRRDPDLGKCIQSSVSNIEKDKIFSELMSYPWNPSVLQNLEVDLGLFKLKIFDVRFSDSASFELKSFRYEY